MEYITLTITKAVYGGDGLGFHDGKAVFVHGALPGEAVKAKIIEEKKDYIRAEIEEISGPSPDRIEPECPNFMTCGGCDYLCINYAEELNIKKAILLDSLTRIGKINETSMPEIKIIFGGRYNYRSHASVKFSNGTSGFYGRSSNELVPFPAEGCLLLNEKIFEHAAKLKTAEGEYKVAVDFSGASFDSSRDCVIRENDGGRIYLREISRFYQANRFLRDGMLAAVKDYSGLSETDTFMDIDCGVGFFSIYLAEFAAQGFGFDIDKESVRWAKINAAENGIRNLKFEASQSSNIYPHRYKPKTVIIDPPRAGLDKKTVKTLSVMKPEIIVYVSCNPATFARDAGRLAAEGYKLEALTLMDMFPCTRHIEVISKFVKQQQS